MANPLPKAVAPHRSQFIDHDLRRLMESVELTGIDRDPEQRGIKHMRRDGQNHDRRMGRVVEIRLDDQSRPRLPEIPCDHTSHNVAALYFHCSKSASSAQSSPPPACEASSDCRRASAARSEDSASRYFSRARLMIQFFPRCSARAFCSRARRNRGLKRMLVVTDSVISTQSICNTNYCKQEATPPQKKPSNQRKEGCGKIISESVTTQAFRQAPAARHPLRRRKFRPTRPPPPRPLGVPPRWA